MSRATKQRRLRLAYQAKRGRLYKRLMLGVGLGPSTVPCPGRDSPLADEYTVEWDRGTVLEQIARRYGVDPCYPHGSYEIDYGPMLHSGWGGLST